MVTYSSYKVLSQAQTSQGIVSSVKPGWLNLQIDVDKFPGIEKIYNNKSTTGGQLQVFLAISKPKIFSGRYLRKYEIIDGDCQILEDNNKVDNKIHISENKNFSFSMDNLASFLDEL